MILDGIPFLEGINLVPGSTLRKDAIRSIVKLLEEKTGAQVVFDARHVPFGRPDLIVPSLLGTLLKAKGIITSFAQAETVPDEPHFNMWSAICADREKSRTGGASFSNDTQALYAALAEGLERYLWFETQDYFKSPVVGAVLDMSVRSSIISPERFVGFTDEQRTIASDRILHPSSTFLWIQGDSLVSRRSIMLPAQAVSGVRGLRVADGRNEPLIRPGTTTGLATWSTKEGAQLRGMLEIIERDAYMITWLNQLIVPRIRLRSICERFTSLKQAVELCARYRLKVNALLMPTDAPAYTVCVVLEDESGVAPRYAFGLKAGRSLAVAVEEGILEALRARRGVRQQLHSGISWKVDDPIQTIGHTERLLYWARPENAVHLGSLLVGKEIDVHSMPWDAMSSSEYFKLLISWCTTNNYECVSVSLGVSARNPTPLFVEMVVMPDMQPTYLHEANRAWGGDRLTAIPKKYGYTPRQTPFTDGPHPFA